MDIRNIIWIGHASFRIDDAPGRIYIDPWKLPNGLPPADLILLTHPHYDHLSEPDIRKIKGPTTLIAGPQAVADRLGPDVTVVKPGGSYMIGKWKVDTIAAYNIGKEFHKPTEGWVGYVVTLSDGTLVYHAGDTDDTDEVRSVKANVALLPCGGIYTMTASEVVAVANSIKPDLLIPMHWGDIVGSRKDAEEVKMGYEATVIVEPQRS